MKPSESLRGISVVGAVACRRCNSFVKRAYPGSGEYLCMIVSTFYGARGGTDVRRSVVTAQTITDHQCTSLGGVCPAHVVQIWPRIL